MEHRIADPHMLSGWRLRCVEMSAPPASQVLEDSRTRGMSGFTMEGGVVILANALVHAAQSLDEARHFLHSKEAESGVNNTILNGHLFSATVALYALLDSFAGLANQVTRPRQTGNVYFLDYKFMHSDFRLAIKNQKMILNLKYDKLSFRDYANKVKHECPWVGRVSNDERSMVLDVYDGVGVGYVYGILIPIHNALVDMVRDQATRRNQTIPELSTM
jgi:hypothetical protein